MKLLQTRSQAVAWIADRTAKNCRGHVTWATPTFREIICAVARHSRYKAANQWSLYSLAQVVFEILRSKRNGVTSLTFQGQVTSLVT